MKQQNIIAFNKEDGNRTSITLSDYQLDILDRLAEFYGKSRNKLLSEIVSIVDGNKRINLSCFVRDIILQKVVFLLNLKGVDL